jgi:D-amino-acid dehydrogenase
MLPNARIELSHTVVDGDMYFGLTPMQGGLRLAGTVELASVNAAPNFTRADNLLKAAKETFPQLNDEGSEQWMGCRPSLPDSLPVIGRSPVHRSVIFAFGHGHLGLTGAATTGKIIADLIAERPPEIDITPFRAERF